MEALLKHYLSLTTEERKEFEFEIRFNSSMVSRSEYDQVLSKLKGLDFDIQSDEHILKIMTESSSIRTDIYGLHAIQQYCKQEVLEGIDDKVILYQEKSKGEKRDYPDFGFRVALQQEVQKEGTNVLNWRDTKKTFRYMNRMSAYHKKYPHIRVDLSVVRNAVRDSFFSVKESSVFQAKDIFEIEMEYINIDDEDVDVKQELKQIKEVITIILSGIQDSLYPIGQNEMSVVAKEYMQLSSIEEKRLLPKHFIGPSSISLEFKHLESLKEGYTVTEKADGKRKMMYIAKNNKVYFITSGLNIQYTGMTCDKGYAGTLVDGEHILQGNIFAIFDIYFMKAVDLRAITFVAKMEGEDSRYGELKRFIREAEFKSPHQIILDINVKEFHIGHGNDIFKQCEKVLSRVYPYEIDGLIFTPAYTGVAIPLGGKPLSYRITWDASFKWKPPEYNTIDFLAITEKNNGEDKIHYKHSNEIKEYKTLLLHVGYDENNPLHGYMQPCDMVLHDTKLETRKGKNYIPKLFYPTNPSDDHAMICNMYLITNDMIAENKEVIEDNMIIECRYDGSREKGWRWIPIRIRHDKTAEYRARLHNYGNAYHVANSVWKSIHQPILRSYFQDPSSIPEDMVDDDIYYNRSDFTHTKPLRDFHNIYVKSKLIQSVAREGGSLFDIAVGKAGDLPKWSRARLGFVMGMDISKDNIENPFDGACARYLNAKKRNKNIFKAVFVQGNSALSIRDGKAITSEQGKHVMTNVFGLTPKNNTNYELLTQVHGMGRRGFDMVSCQFALHYFFASKSILDTFIDNVKLCCRLDGYFIGTMYDGETVFNLLKDKAKGDVLTYYMGEHKIWEVTKKYDMETFDDNETSLGYAIDVYQDSINKTFTEYLVHFEYFKEYMKEHGFRLITKEDAKRIGLPNGTGMFTELFYAMKREKKSIYENALKMEDEKELSSISFMNRYFVFQKVTEKDTQREPELEKNTRLIKKDILRVLNDQQLDKDQYLRFIRALKTIGYQNDDFDENQFVSFLQSIRNDDYTDYQIYNKYLDSLPGKTKETKREDCNTRGQNRVKQVSYYLQKRQFESYLDFGCGDGSISRAIKDHFKLNDSKVYGADIIQYPSMDMQYLPIVYGETNYVPLNLPNNSMDLVTTFMVLHHIRETYIQDVLRDLYRIIKPGGMLLIREHNAPIDNGAFKRVLDIVHDVYDYIIEAEMNWENKEDYYSNYKGYKEWELMLENVGFKRSKIQKRIYRNINTNPMETYYRLYLKPDLNTI